MTSTSSPPLLSAENFAQEVLSAPTLGLHQYKVVLVIDLVESVHLMAANEAAVVERWMGFMRHAEHDVLPRQNGRLVKSLGDGLLAEFDHPSQAVQTAMALHRYFNPVNQSLPAAEQMHLRAGINAAHLYVDTHDVYGHGVNLAARVADLGAPGDTVVTASVCDGIVDGIDAQIEDMGESYLKHWPEPVRTWRVHPVEEAKMVWRHAQREAVPIDFRPSIAVVPFEARNPSPEYFVIGELIADGVIAQLSRSQDLRVISRLSTTAFRGRSTSHGEIDARLDAAFVLSGNYTTLGSKVVIMVELADTRRNEVLWAERLSGDTMDLMEVHSELMATISTACARALLNAEVQRSLVLPLPKLHSNSLMLGGITLMHRSTPRDLKRSRQLLEAVAERHKRVAAPWAWLAKWHIMQVVQGLTSNPADDFRRAMSVADKALDLEPNSSMAMAIKGHAMCHLGHDLDASKALLNNATQMNPNDPMAWLYRGFWSCMWGNATVAVSESEQAQSLSPVDPQRFYFEMLLANSYLMAGQLSDTISMCQSSLQKNRYHAPTLRALLTAQHESGQTAEARKTFDVLLSLQPDLTVSKFLSYGSTSSLRQRGAEALKSLGLPEH